MGNYLKMASQQHISALLVLGWSQRHIASEVGVHRETVGRYAVMRQANPANPIAGSAAETRPNPIPGPPSAAAPYHDGSAKDWRAASRHSGSGRTCATSTATPMGT